MERKISEKIDEIIAKRKEKVPFIEKREQSIKNAIEAVEKVDRFKSSVVDENGNINADSKYLGVFSGDPEALQALVSFDGNIFCKKGKALLETYGELKERFSRDFINIAVVGPARQGKSTFLQSVTGLDNRCIPAMDGGHCTGAPSVIENGNNDKVTAEITFKSESEMLDEIQAYLTKATRGKGRIYSLEDVKNLSDEKLSEWMKDIPIEERTKCNDTVKKFIKDRFRDHYEKWRPLVGKDMLTESNEDIIMEYVAQHNEEKIIDDTGELVDNKNFTEYWNFVAVKSARIIKKFQYEDCGKIRLIDTVGLGSTEENVEQNMFNTIREKSDGVMFFKKPDPNVRGTEDDKLLGIYDRLTREFYHSKMEKWFTYVINRTRECNKPRPQLDNLSMCKLFEKDILEAQLPLMSINIIDASKHEEVIDDFLVDYLSQLSQNIDEIDKVFMDETHQKALEVLDDYDRLCKKLTKIISVNNSLNGDMGEYGDRFEDVYLDLFDKCHSINIEYSQKRNDICDVLFDRCKKIMNEIFDLIPAEEEIHKSFRGDISFQQVYGHYMDVARDKLTKQFICIDDDLRCMLDELKSAYADALLNDGRLSKILPLEENEKSLEWLKRFQNMLDDKKQLDIKYACGLLNEFSLSIKSFLMYRIRTSIFGISRANGNLTSKNPGNREDYEAAVIYYMKQDLENIKNTLEISLKNFYTAPNEALYSVSDQFYDLIRFSESSKKEWRSIYLDRNNYPRIWSDEISKEISESEALQEWLDLWNSLKEFNRKDCFVL